MDAVVPSVHANDGEARQHDDFTSEDIDDMHVTSATFVNLWVKLMTGDHVTNYMHIIGAGQL